MWPVDFILWNVSACIVDHFYDFGFNVGRHKQLESILVVTQKFHETLEPLSDWLQATEKHLANSEPIGTESSKLEKQISQQKVPYWFSVLVPHAHFKLCLIHLFPKLFIF